MFDQGLYVFLMRLRSPATIEVGALGRFVFPAGWYAYTGQAKRALKKRVERHWAVKKNVRWHIDYLSTAPDSEPVGAVVVPLGVLEECELNRLVGLVVRGPSPAPGFGASDCREKCPAHLWFSVSPISLLTLARVHKQAAVLMPGADFELEQLHSLGESDLS
jgi:Uri superfamily endonuclease